MCVYVGGGKGRMSDTNGNLCFRSFVSVANQPTDFDLHKLCKFKHIEAHHTCPQRFKYKFNDCIHALANQFAVILFFVLLFEL